MPGLPSALKFAGYTFSYDFYSTVIEISHPTDELEVLCNILCVSPKEHALDSTGDNNVKSFFLFHFFLFLPVRCTANWPQPAWIS